MSYLKFNIDAEGDLCIWKGEGEPLAFNIHCNVPFASRLDGVSDISKLYQKLDQLIQYDSNSWFTRDKIWIDKKSMWEKPYIRFEREKYGEFSIKIHSKDQYKITGQSGYYICNKTDIDALHEFLKEYLIAQRYFNSSYDYNDFLASLPDDIAKRVKKPPV